MAGCDWPREDQQVKLVVHEHQGVNSDAEVLRIFTLMPQRPATRKVRRKSNSQLSMLRRDPSVLCLGLAQHVEGLVHEFLQLVELSGVREWRGAFHELAYRRGVLAAAQPALNPCADPLH